MVAIRQVQGLWYSQESTPLEWSGKCSCIKTPLKMTDKTPENQSSTNIIRM